MKIIFDYSDEELLDHLLKFPVVQQIISKKADTDSLAVEALIKIGFTIKEISDKDSLEKDED